MTEKAANAESEFEEIARLEAEIVDFTRRKAECEAQVKAMRLAENPAAGVFHHTEIFELSQTKLIVETEIMARRNKINRIRYYMDTFGADRPR